MKTITKIFLFIILGTFALIAALNIWGATTLGTIKPLIDQARDNEANKVVMVFGATGSAGDGLLKAAIDDKEVKKIIVVTRRTSPRIEKGIASGKVEMRILKDFTDYSSIAAMLTDVNTVLWGLGLSSLEVDDATYTRIHVDFPVAFVKQWLSMRSASPMSFHYISGMGTDGSAHWALEKSRTERELAALASDSELRTFSYRSAFIRPTTERANTFHYLLASLLKPGSLVISSEDLGAAMLEIAARTTELENGTLIDNADSIAYARVYREKNIRK
jgi:hypothetical protein